jgi:hypothetical protein
MGYILASKTYTENGEKYHISVEGGLHYIKGNSAPYFTITADIKRIAKNGRRVWEAGGCLHEEILKHFPQFADLVDLHLSDIDGAPTHAEANGAYWLGFSDYQGFDLEKASSHFRMPKDQLKDEWMKIIRKDDVKQLTDKLRPTWKQQAQECINRHKLGIFGNEWASEVSA